MIVMEASPIKPPVQISTRKAICGGVHRPDHSTDMSTIHEIRDSSPDLPNFEDCSDGSYAATKLCKVCHFNMDAHDLYGIMWRGEHAWERHGAWEFDSFDCGHGKN